MKKIIPRFIFVTGGVVSSLGKGVATAAVGAALRAKGYSCVIKKLDPYLNIDPGTMNPIQHGEVYVTEDGTETDLDLGHYERLAGIETNRNSSITSGKIFQDLLLKERRGDYLGSTVQIIPHMTNLICEFIKGNTEGKDFVLCEIGGTVGDIEGAPFLEAARQMRREAGEKRVVFVHVTLLPYMKASQELKTKPSQHSVKALMASGIEPNILLCRTERPISESERKKLSIFCNVEEKNVIGAPDLETIYEAPLVYANNGLDSAILNAFGIKSDPRDSVKELSNWKVFLDKMHISDIELKIVLVGKYAQSHDAYRSLIDGIRHACVYNKVRPIINVISADNIANIRKELKEANIVIVPGGFGINQTDGKIEAIRLARENKIPFLGICFGMQLAVIEFCRNVLGIKDATSREFLPDNQNNVVIDIIEKSVDADGVIRYRRQSEDMGGTLHLGAKSIAIKDSTLAYQVYGSHKTSERHRHRYQVVMDYKEKIESKGGIFSGFSDDTELPEIFEINKFTSQAGKQETHPFFISCQFHPEFKSSPFAPHKLILGLIRAGLEFSKNKR